MSAVAHKLLIVDDEKFNRVLLEMILDDPEFELFFAVDGVEALETLNRLGSCDVILLDHMMPNMDGLQLLKQLKNDPRFRDIPVIMQTAAGKADQEQVAMDAGAFGYVVKPYDDDKILSSVRSALQKAKDSGADNKAASS